MSNLSVNFVEYFSAAAFRHLNTHSTEKIKIYMLPSEDGLFAIEKEKNEKFKIFGFKIEKLGVTFTFRLLLSPNSKCDSLLTSEFANSLIWAVDPAQDYVEEQALSLNKESSTYLFHVEIAGSSDECLLLNIAES